MHTHPRRGSPALLLLGGLVIALVGVGTHTLEYTLPAALLLAGAGVATVSRRRRPPLPRYVPPGLPVPAMPVVPTQRTPSYPVPYPVLPTPSPGFGEGPDRVAWVTRRAPALRPYADRPPVARPARSVVGRPRHCVLPRGEVPHQRRAPGTS